MYDIITQLLCFKELMFSSNFYDVKITLITKQYDLITELKKYLEKNMRSKNTKISNFSYILNDNVTSEKLKSEFMPNKFNYYTKYMVFDSDQTDDHSNKGLKIDFVNDNITESFYVLVFYYPIENQMYTDRFFALIEASLEINEEIFEELFLKYEDIIVEIVKNADNYVNAFIIYLYEIYLNIPYDQNGYCQFIDAKPYILKHLLGQPNSSSKELIFNIFLLNFMFHTTKYLPINRAAFNNELLKIKNINWDSSITTKAYTEIFNLCKNDIKDVINEKKLVNILKEEFLNLKKESFSPNWNSIDPDMFKATSDYILNSHESILKDIPDHNKEFFSDLFKNFYYLLLKDAKNRVDNYFEDKLEADIIIIEKQVVVDNIEELKQQIKSFTRQIQCLT